MESVLEYLNEDKIVTVMPLSSKGKNRIYEHGDRWAIKGFNKSIKNLKLMSVRTGYIRWVDIDSDPDFVIVKPLIKI